MLIHPFDHVDIVAGQGTAGLEILEQAPDVRTVVVPTGGGGLLAGIAIAVKAMRPDVRVVGVQAEGAAAYPGSLAKGAPVKLDSMKTMADGIAVGLPGDVTFAAVRDHVDDIVTVSEESMSQALLALMERAKMVVEPAGAAAVAAMLDHPTAFETPAVAVLSGGNIDPLLLGKVIRHGMAAAGRYLYLRVNIPDLPGGLAVAAPRARRGRRERPRGRPRADLAVTCTSTRSRCGSRWRPAASRTPSGCSPGSARAATGSTSSPTPQPDNATGRRPARETPARRRTGSAVVRHRVHDLDRHLVAVGRGVAHGLALGAAVDRGAHGGLGRVDLERVVLTLDLARTEEELLLARRRRRSGR